MSKKVSDEILVDIDIHGNKTMKKYEVVPKNWGKEIILINSEKYCSKILHLEKDRKCSIHYHREKDEIFHFVDGYVLIELWYNLHKIINPEQNPEEFEKKPSEKMKFWPGSTLHIPPWTAHRFTGIENSTFIEVSTQDKKEDSYRIVPSPPR